MAEGEVNLCVRVERAEIDTAKPFESVKAAVTLFGEKIGKNQQKFPEPHNMRDCEFHKLQDELRRVREQVKRGEQIKLKALCDVSNAKKLLEDLGKKAGKVRKLRQMSDRGIESRDSQRGEVEEELESEKANHVLSVFELESSKQELDALRREMALILEEKESVERQAEEAAVILEERRNKLLLVFPTLSCFKLEATKENLKKVKEEGDHLKQVVEHTHSTLSSFKLEATKANLKKVKEEGDRLKQVVERARSELELLRREIACLRKREVDASMEAMVLSEEIKSERAELDQAISAEAIVKNSIDGLSKILRQLSEEAEGAEREAGVLREEACRAREGGGRQVAKDLMDELELRLENALREAELAKADEARSVNQVRELYEKTYTKRSSGVDPATRITISHEEYELLKRKAKEAEEIASMKAAAAAAGTEAVNASKHEILRKLDSVNEDKKETERATEQALHRAAMAEAAKSVLEKELKRWREKEQQQDKENRRASENDGNCYYYYNYNNNGHQSLASLLNIELPRITEDKRKSRELNKVPSIPSLATYLSEKTQ